jgi:RHS repeat-associated protein
LSSFGYTIFTYDANTGRLTNVRAGATNNVADFDYAYDLLGNATYRADGYAGVFERFCYDALNRLTKSALAVGSDPGTSCAGGTVKTIGYDSIGDITSKSDVGTYSYPTSGSGAVRPHAISSITGTVNGVTNPSYTYDPNGNMTAGAGRTVTLSSFNMVLSIVQGTTSVALRYDPEHMRSSRVDSVGGASSSTGFVLDPANGATSELYNDGSVLHWHDYLEVDGHYVAERFCDGYPTCTGPTWKYFVTDNLGSIASITDSAGTVLERDAYDPWGRPRVYATGADDPTCGSVPPPITKRGYTGHEHIESECLVNANARIYDPTVGRFMSPDTTVTDPTDLQDWNPYSYVDNRPMTMTDPNGHTMTAAEFDDLQEQLNNNPTMGLVYLNPDSLPSGYTSNAMGVFANEQGEEGTGNSPGNTSSQQDTGPDARVAQLQPALEGAVAACEDVCPQAGRALGLPMAPGPNANSVTDDKDPKNLYYRALTSADQKSLAAGNGIAATDPNANISIDDHIAKGIKPSQYISMTRSAATAASYAGQNGIVIIDADVLRSTIDVSRGSIDLSIVGNYNAIRDSEVLAIGHIPQSAIVKVIDRPSRPIAY